MNPDTPTKELPYLEIGTPHRMKYTLFNRFKTAAWNFILPPHVHLSLRKPKSEEKS